MNPPPDRASNEIAAPARHWLYPTRRGVIAGLLLAFALWGWFDVRNRATNDGTERWTHKTDLTVYTEAGAAFFDGREPYSVSNPRGWHYLYPPLFAILLAPLHALEPPNQAIVWFAISVLLGYGCYRELVRIARAVLPGEPERGMFGPMPPWLGGVACAAAMLPALNCLQRGQVGVAKLYFLLLGFRLLVESRSAIGPILAGCALAFPVVIKVTPAVPLAIVLAQRFTAAWCLRTRAAWTQAAGLGAGAAAALTIGVLLLPAALVGWNANLEHLHTWWNKVARQSTSETDFAGDSTAFRNQSLTNAAYRLGNWAHYYFADGPYDNAPGHTLRETDMLMDAPAVDAVLLAVRALAAALAVAVALRMGHAQDQLGAAAAFGVGCAATLIVFSIARGHYYVMLLPAVAFVSLWLLRQERPRWSLALAIAPLVLVITHYALLDFAGRIGLLGLGTTLWYFAACGALLLPVPARAVQVATTPTRLRAHDSAAGPLAA